MNNFLAAPIVEPGLAVIRPVRDVTASAGETVLFECHVVGPKDTDVDWLADGKLIQPALLNCKMHFDGRKCRLLLNSVHEDDSGTYTCKLSTAKGTGLTSPTHFACCAHVDRHFTPPTPLPFRGSDIMWQAEGHPVHRSSLHQEVGCPGGDRGPQRSLRLQSQRDAAAKGHLEPLW